MNNLPPDLPETGIIVFERMPYWGPELKRQFSDQSVSIRECRSIADLSPSMALFRGCVVIVLLDAAPADCLRWIDRQSETNQPSPIMVIASVEYAELEWTIREAGAAAFLNDEIGGQEVARLCSRMMRAADCPPVAAAFQR